MRFFLQSFVFCLAGVLAVGGAYEFCIQANWFPPPPPAWSKVIGEMRETSDNLEKTAERLQDTATSLVSPLKDSIELAKRIVDKLPPAAAPPSSPSPSDFPAVAGSPTSPVLRTPAGSLDSAELPSSPAPVAGTAPKFSVPLPKPSPVPKVP